MLEYLCTYYLLDASASKRSPRLQSLVTWPNPSRYCLVSQWFMESLMSFIFKCKHGIFEFVEVTIPRQHLLLGGTPSYLLEFARLWAFLDALPILSGSLRQMLCVCSLFGMFWCKLHVSFFWKVRRRMPGMGKRTQYIQTHIITYILFWHLGLQDPCAFMLIHIILPDFGTCHGLFNRCFP